MRNRQATKLIFELSQPGRRAALLPESDVLADTPIGELIPDRYLGEERLGLPEVSEFDVVRHYTNLSTQNMSVDTHFYPLGSCTMKYNPKRNERMAALSGFSQLHPYQDESTIQGMLELLYHLQTLLAEVSGLPAVSLQPAAGAHGELTALMAAAAYFRDVGQKRTKVLAPDSAHGTNPASAHIAGFDFVSIGSTPEGYVDMVALERELDDQIAVFMITNPNTLGLFDANVAEIARRVHDKGGFVYLDGANMNAILGISRPGDFGADMMHFNPHKTFSTPHGGGGPGAGPICVIEKLRPYLPTPTVELDGDRFGLSYDCPKSIGRVRSFFGNVGVLVRAYAYLMTHGAEGLKRVSESAVLSANYLLSRVKHILPVPQGDRCMHEFVASVESLKKEKGVTAMDIAKRLLDYGFHAPTVYFPMTVPEAMMIEPTDTETKETLDAFCEALFRITEESNEDLHDAPFSTAVRRPDEVKAARKPVVKWSSED